MEDHAEQISVRAQGAQRARIIRMTEEAPDDAALREAGAVLARGGLVAFPTETVYGLGGNALDPDAARKIYAAKGRPSDNPLIVHIASVDALARIAAEVPDAARRLAARYWPGPLTMIFRKTDAVPPETTGGLDSVAVRFPRSRIAGLLIRYAGGYVAAPSANTSGRPSPTLASHVIEDLGDRIDCIIDGGQVEIGLESTIVDFTAETPVILRPGYINRRMLASVLGQVEVDPGLQSDDASVRPKAPGMKYRHYAPKADLTIVEGSPGAVSDLIRRLTREKISAGLRVGIICTDETADSYPEGTVWSLGARSDEDMIAHHLYEILRESDSEEIDVIYSEAFRTPNIGQAIMNRLMKAAGHRVLQADTVRAEQSFGDDRTMMQFEKIIFVDADATARGVMAAAIMREEALAFEAEILARGLVVLFPEPVNQKIEAVLANNGLTAKGHEAVQLSPDDLDEHTLVLVMEEEQIAKVRALSPRAEHVYTVGGFVGFSGDIAPLYGADLPTCGKCFELLQGLVKIIVTRLNEEDEIE